MHFFLTIRFVNKFYAVMNKLLTGRDSGMTVNNIQYVAHYLDYKY